MTHEHLNGENVNGGMLAKFGKYSWTLILIGLIGGPISTFFMMRETMTVGLNAAEIRITSLEQESKEQKEMINRLQQNVVPRSEHEAMLKDQDIIAHWKEKYNDSVQGSLQHQIDQLRDKK